MDKKKQPEGFTVDFSVDDPYGQLSESEDPQDDNDVGDAIGANPWDEDRPGPLG